ncbi:transcription-repair-coupling factor [Philodulcilactobacillus myokoensis]|uniref:Transcription-repair-coupling factor n=1 Tax=Philodulcilactobacillus myokoensis TaxID=2929573 RepID=A0A9W6B284_9LACO|nr:transcription-repair coupling factor [Philodulcilactobacillus myokoensis]GLB47206.1 transcription-repair-coupling factor [Philodulcilactobacillus myokoensis]
MKLTQFLTKLPQYNSIIKNIQPKTRQLVTGMADSSRALLLKTIHNQLKKPLLLVTDTLYHADQIANDFESILPSKRVFEFPAEELIAAEAATSSPQFKSQRVKSLSALLSDKPVVVITSVSGARRFLPSKDEFKNAKINIKVGSNYKLRDLNLKLHQMGYVKKSLVASPGEFAIRGSILDVYPLNAEYPVRLDFFDTELDSLRYFDAAKQSSIKKIKQFEILPATDFVVSEDERKQGAKKIASQLNDSLSDIDDKKLSKTMSDHIQPIIDQLNQGLSDSKWLLFSHFLFEQPNSIFDYLPKDGIVAFDDYNRLMDSNKQLVSDENNWAETKLEHAEIFSKQTFGHDFKNEFKRIPQAEILFSQFQKGLGQLKLDQVNDIRTHPMQKFYGQLPLLKTETDRWQKNNSTVIVMISDRSQFKKMNQAMNDFKIPVVNSDEDHIIENKIQLIPERLNEGFEIPLVNLVVITESEMFAKVHKHHRRSQPNFSNAQRIKSYTDLKPGDYVVHVNHGIGKYEGMKTMEIDGKHKDYLSIQYRDNAKLFIPVNQLNLIQKYVSSSDGHPRMNKLGGTEWQRTKRRVANKIEDIADSLIDLYAKRSSEKGIAFPPDDDEQSKFEDDFPYTETPDQLRSVKEIKQDMEKPHPMDRLLVGDVGYGKTEVALRAAFKAIDGHHQVAFLVPTTVLAHQHYETMLNRFHGWPIKVGVLSRFRTPKQIKATIKGLKDGDIDIVVGTHRLLSKDVKFKKLGLLIVDEEQRFGVKHKEKIKKLQSNVDVLTLTATPIPRTLNMSMMGVRDLSVIETPPTNRFPIQTYVMEENAGAIREGIRREMQRGGQVFYLHNRVNDIQETVQKIQRLVPDAKITYIDGQMNERQMEDTLYDFIHDEYDVLVTTTIIESGVDIPNTNTLFVENADHMGLSQLYQIRGRIGRSSRVAYAYFMYQPNKVLTEVSENRLEAIRDFTELGSGFRIAMRDLSIRGAGNLLGKQQHGFINSVGYDLYTQMLSDAVAKKRGNGDKGPKETNAKVKFSRVESYLPNDYISDPNQKIEIYKRIKQMHNLDDYHQIKNDLIDRFGKYPMPAANLLKVGLLKTMADETYLESIQDLNGQFKIILSKTGKEFYGARGLMKALAQTKFKSTIDEKNDQFIIQLVVQPDMSEVDCLDNLLKFVLELNDLRLEKMNQ